eukprot:GHVT01061197.1.p1 GENE.GHVT01061197.1~~GHVT01061197.1.p1  ORF type:complete len:529 (-),score=67.51 GHVT01061197.1:1260-2846(-)
MRGGVRDGRAWWALYLPLRAFVNAVTRPLLLMCLGFILAVLFSAPSLFHLQSHPPSDWRCFPSWRDSKFDSRCVAAIGSLGNFRLSNVPSILLASGLPSYQMSSSNPFSNYQPASYSSSYNQSPNYYPSYTASSSSNRPSSRGSTFYPRPSSSSYYPRASSSSSSGNVYRSQRTQQPRHSSRRTTQPAGRGASFDLPRSVRSSTSQFSATEPANQDVELTNLPSFPSSSDATPANIAPPGRPSTSAAPLEHAPRAGSFRGAPRPSPAAASGFSTTEGPAAASSVGASTAAAAAAAQSGSQAFPADGNGQRNTPMGSSRRPSLRSSQRPRPSSSTGSPQESVVYSSNSQTDAPLFAPTTERNAVTTSAPSQTAVPARAGESPLAIESNPGRMWFETEPLPSPPRGPDFDPYADPPPSEFPNSPYHRYAYAAEPFSSTYSTHSAHEEYGSPYNNKYFRNGDLSPIIDWRDYARRQKEIRASIKEETAADLALGRVGVIETSEIPYSGVIGQGRSRRGRRPVGNMTRRTSH